MHSGEVHFYYDSWYQNENPLKLRISRKIPGVLVVTFLCFLYVGPSKARGISITNHTTSQEQHQYPTTPKPVTSGSGGRIIVKG